MRREEAIEWARRPESWDLIVLGGGASGLGVALDSALRGYRTLLVDAFDFAKGTSSRSTKLIHGGVRYLAAGRVGLVREALLERTRLLRNAPHVVRPQSFVIPAYRPLQSAYYRLGLGVYDFLAGSQGLGRAESLSRNEAIGQLGTIRQEGLRGGVLYWDTQFDDARLAIVLLRSFLGSGGTALNYVSAIGFHHEGGRISGVLLEDAESGERWTATARVVVNATGVFSDAIRRLDDASAPPQIRPSRGSHLVVDARHLPGGSALLVPETDDGRVLFAIPWLGRVLIGTTDIPVLDAPTEPIATGSEVDYLLNHANRFIDPPIGRAHILSTFSGLRPLFDPGQAASTKGISREHAVIVSPTGLVSLIGGKWTTYRKMAAHALDRAVEVGGLPVRPCLTADYRLQGAPIRPIDPADPLSGYGTDAPALRELIASDPSLGEPLHPRLPLLGAQVVWAARMELARTVEDVLSRRTRCLLLDASASIEAAASVADLLGSELGRDHAWRTAQLAAFASLASGYDARTR